MEASSLSRVIGPATLWIKAIWGEITARVRRAASSICPICGTRVPSRIGSASMCGAEAARESRATACVEEA